MRCVCTTVRVAPSVIHAGGDCRPWCFCLCVSFFCVSASVPVLPMRESFSRAATLTACYDCPASVLEIGMTMAGVAEGVQWTCEWACLCTMCMCMSIRGTCVSVSVYDSFGMLAPYRAILESSDVCITAFDKHTLSRALPCYAKLDDRQ
eukprot:55773-Eustigmatos_ZCMA.PRE.1